ncbi:cell wall-binding repeat-containing protein [Microbacterium gallinarum]|uniref:Cell wall-binding repeat-containing protein n=1 Tax=Microbacterium gallinarum TaxID=2762209 RepID=A0ABR8X4C2_9MICO|nr:cell wall-binding repeat-containing protein [Microbacterium gallinarum]MBD8023756.1 cell wall-binding repeat-containing protein [Microbacterium gallinarum]
MTAIVATLAALTLAFTSAVPAASAAAATAPTSSAATAPTSSAASAPTSRAASASTSPAANATAPTSPAANTRTSPATTATHADASQTPAQQARALQSEATQAETTTHTLTVHTADDLGNPIVPGPPGRISLVAFGGPEPVYTSRTWYRGSMAHTFVVESGTEYTVLVSDWEGDYASGYLGSVPGIDRAQRFTPTADLEVTVVMPRAVTVKGRIAAASGVVASHRIAQVWSFDPVTKAPMGWNNAIAAPDGTYEVDGLWPGELRVAFLNDSGFESAAAYEYYPSVAERGDAQLLPATPGEVLEGIDGMLRPWSFLPARRVSGPDRYATALSVSSSKFTSADVAFIAGGMAWPDALSAAPAAATMDAPLLLTPRESVAPGLLDELRRLGVSRILIAGGEGAVSKAVATRLATVAPVERLAGADRYATSRTIVDFAFGDYSRGYLATGRDFPDALSAAAFDDRFVLLVPSVHEGGFDAGLRDFLYERGMTVGIVGGTEVLDDSYQRLADYLSGWSNGGIRYAGQDRFETNRLLHGPVANVLKDTDYAYVASGFGFADALAVAPVAAAEGAPLYLARPTCVDAPLRTHMQQSHLRRPILVGGAGALSDAVGSMTACR